MGRKSNSIVSFHRLDNLRFWAFLGVFCYHSFIYRSDSPERSFLFNVVRGALLNGNTGVNIFYVLSGFLIFYHLQNERLVNGSIDIRRFYLNRIIRIWPLYIICIVYGFYLYPMIKQSIHEPFVQNHHLLYYLTFTNNFETEKRFPNCFYLSVLWSIAVEFQFYILSPFIARYLSGKTFIGFLTGIILISLGFRIFCVNNYAVLYFNTLSVMSDFALGGIAAYIILFRKDIMQSLGRMSNLVKGSISAVTVLLLLAKRQLFHLPALIVMERIIVGAGIAFIILLLAMTKSATRRTLPGRLAKYTYGFYCYHIIAITTATYIYDKLVVFQTDISRFFATPVLSFILVVIMELTSYHLYEKQFFRLKPASKAS